MGAALTEIAEGPISVGEAPASWGFTADRWMGGSYLWRSGNRITCSFLHVREPGKGAFRHLVDAIEADGFKVAVPCPLGNFPVKLRHMGFVRGAEYDENLQEAVEVWMKPVRDVSDDTWTASSKQSSGQSP